MNPLPPAAAVKIAPAHTLTSKRFADFWRVLAWSLWSPRTFTRYVDWLLRSDQDKTPFPKLPDREQRNEWWEKNPHQRALVGLAWEVGVALLLGLLLLNLLPAATLPFEDALTVLAFYLGYVVTFALIWGVFLGVSLFWTAFVRQLLRIMVKPDNVGSFLALALSGGLAFALIWFIIWWGQFIAYFFAADWSLRAAIFIVWGYGLGYCANSALAVAQKEVTHLRKFVGWYFVACGVILLLLLAKSGASLADLLSLPIQHHAPALYATLSCCIGLLAGLLRPLEYLLLQWRRAPGFSEEERNRSWALPGSTLLPVYRIQSALESWLDADRDEGVHIASQLSNVSRQQQPLIVPLQRQLAVCGTDELLELGFGICDSGASCAKNVVMLPQTRKSSTQARRGKGQDRRTYEHEVALAHALRQAPNPPEFKLDGDASTATAILWYYNEGYLYKAAKVWRKAGGSKGAIALSSPRMAELGALIEAFASLVDLDSASASPTSQLRRRPAAQFRIEAWTLIDQLAGATLWAWRARHCEGLERDACYTEFSAKLKQIVERAKSNSLAEKKVVDGIARHWQDQIKKLLQDGKVQLSFEAVHIRPWETIHGELNTLDPWRQFSAELHKHWQPGHTAVLLVDGLPKSKMSRAIEAAAVNPPSTALASYDLDELPNDQFTLTLLVKVCMGVAGKLKSSHSLPTGLASLKLNTVRNEIIRLCEQAPVTPVVVYLENSKRLVNGSVPHKENQLAFEELIRLERRIHNLALTLESDGRNLTEQLRSKFALASLPVEPVYVPLLVPQGVQRWLELQFGASGVHFEAGAADKVCRLTGGHTGLLEHLGNCIAANYNNGFPSPPSCPLITEVAVDLAATSTRYSEPVGKFGQAVKRQYGHEDHCRFVLEELAEITEDGLTITVGGIVSSGSATGKPSQDYVQGVLNHWEKVGLVEQVADPASAPAAGQPSGQPGYRLRSLSLALWLLQNKN